MLNALCRMGQHDWLPVLVSSPGWYCCSRADCRVVAVCPGCLERVPTGVSVMLYCSKHQHLAASLFLPERSDR